MNIHAQMCVDQGHLQVMELPVVKLPAIVVVQLAMYFGLRRVNPPKKHHSKPSSLQTDPSTFHRLQILFLFFTRCLCWLHGTIEILLIVFPNTLTPYLLPINKDISCIHLSVVSTFATALAASGAILRHICFHEMGKQFTYHLTIVDDHKLVTTGPYSIVRHPAYVGAYFLDIGHVLWYLARGSWLRESEIYKMKSAWLILGPVLWFIVFALGMFVRRTRVEDAMLKKQFGEEWTQWASKVPYRLVPGVY